MKLRDFRLLSDENIDPEVVAHLRSVGFDVLDVCENGLHGSIDVDLVRLAFAENRVIVTHDADFGTLAVLQNEPLIGLIFLRPGHIDSQFTIATFQAVLGVDPDLAPPFVLVAKRTDIRVAVRVRHLRP
jgi:predicted nuclease of predicted toxin-antitoxin system